MVAATTAAAMVACHTASPSHGVVPSESVAASATYDVIIENGRVVDGSGKASTLKLPLSVKWDTVADLKIFGINSFLVLFYIFKYNSLPCVLH